MRVVNLGEFARAWAVHTRKIGWLLGAGTSAAAGIPTAAGIVDDLLLRCYAADFKQVRQHLDPADPALMARVRMYYDGAHGMPPLGSPGDYSAAFEMAMPDPQARRRYLGQLLADRRPSYGQRVLGAGIVAGVVDLVITTNFDRLPEQAAADAHHAREDGQARLLNVSALDSRRRAPVAAADDAWPLLIKLHGDFQEESLKNLDAELNEQDATLRQVVLDCSRRFGLAVAGYSGRDHSVMQMLTASIQQDAWPSGLWWLTRDPQSLPDPVRELLDRAEAVGVRACVVQAETFDESMGALADQVDLDEGVRAYVDGLRPRERIIDAPLPGPDGDRFPVLRLNALPVLRAPERVLRAVVPADLTGRQLRGRLKQARWRAASAMGPGEVLSFGTAGELQAALGAEQLPKVVQLNLLAENAPAHHAALALHGLARGLALRLPGHTQLHDVRPRLVLDPARDGEPESFADIRRTLQQAYDQPLCGQVPRKYGVTEAGDPRRYAEAIELRLERWLDHSWLIFTPMTWVEPSAEIAKARKELSGPVPRDPSTTWIGERWAQRRRNEIWAGLLDAWSQALAPRTADALVHALPKKLGDVPGAVGGSFELGTTTAYSRKAGREA